jgi:hypothetical protein
MRLEMSQGCLLALPPGPLTSPSPPAEGGEGCGERFRRKDSRFAPLNWRDEFHESPSPPAVPLSCGFGLVELGPPKQGFMGRRAAFPGIPLSPTLSPLVPRGEREKNCVRGLTNSMAVLPGPLPTPPSWGEGVRAAGGGATMRPCTSILCVSCWQSPHSVQ